LIRRLDDRGAPILFWLQRGGLALVTAPLVALIGRRRSACAA